MHYIQSWRPWECDSPTGDAKPRLPREAYDRAMDLAEEAMNFWQNTKRHTRQKGYSEIEVIFGVLIGHLHKDKKCRIVIDYDPAEKYVDVREEELATTREEQVAASYELSIEDIKNADAENELEQAVKDAMLYSMEKTPDGEIEIRSYRDGLIKLENPEHVNWFISQIQKLSGGTSHAND